MVHWLRESNVRNWSSCDTLRFNFCWQLQMDGEYAFKSLTQHTKWSFIMPSATVVYYHKTLLCSLYETETEQSKYVVRLFGRNYVRAKAEKHQYLWLRVYNMWEPQSNEIDKFIPPAPIFLHCPLETRQQLPAFQAQTHMCFFSPLQVWYFILHVIYYSARPLCAPLGL